MILIFLNPSTFAHETADIKLAYIQSAVSWANVDGFKKLKIMVAHLNLYCVHILLLNIYSIAFY